MYNEEIWSLRVLVPFWVVQTCLQLISILFLTFLLADESGTFKIIPASDVILLVCCIVSLVIGPLEMLFQSLNFLQPWLYLCFQVFKVLFAMTYFADELYRYLTLDKRELFPIDEAAVFAWALVVNTALGLLLMLSCFVSLIHGFVIVHRHRKSHAYDPEKERGSYGD